MLRKERFRDGLRVFHCCAVLGMAHFSPGFPVREASTQQVGVWWGEINIHILLIPLLILLEFVGDPLSLRLA